MGESEKVASSSRSGSGENGSESARPEQSAATQAAPATATPEKKPSKIKQLWQKSGLDVFTVLMMIKGSLPPTIAIAIYQAPAVSAHYSTLGYLMAIFSVLGMAIMPRGKFIQTMSLNVLAICIGAAVNLLALWTAMQARAHTKRPGESPTAYSSSASAVCAIWLFFQIYIINYARIKRPAFQLTIIIYSIFTIVSMSYGPTFPNMTASLSFMKRLIETTLSGLALSTGVSLVFVPVSSRTVVFKQMTGYLACINGMLAVQTQYMQSLESLDPIELHAKHVEEQAQHAKKSKKPMKPRGPLDTPASDALHGTLMKLLELHSKLGGDIESAKREFAIGKLDCKDIKELWKRLRFVFIPVLGLSSTIDILRRQAQRGHWDSADLPQSEADSNKQQVESVHRVMRALHEPFATVTANITSGIQHAQMTLELVKPPKAKTEDVEGKASQTAPGSPAFAEAFRQKLESFRKSRHVTLERWCHENGHQLPAGFFDQPTEDAVKEEENVPEDQRRQLFFMLYIEYLLFRAGQATLDLVLFADQTKQDGKLAKSRLILPGGKTMRKWFVAVFTHADSSKGDHLLEDIEDGARDSVYMGQDFERRKDPEHLPPQNAMERFGNHVRGIPAFFRDPASAFGFRVACATMSVAIINYLHASQTFFQRNRLLWSMIMIAISMSRLSGQSTYNFILRVGGTAVAMVGSYIIWYIVDGKTAGAIVFLWLWMTCAFYLVLKVPKLIIVGILSIVTSVLIIGYELQTKAIGIAASESNGQPFYPTYLLAPYRLATVAAGLLVAWVWTIFPYPVSENSELRKDLGASMYLLANFATLAREMIKSRLKDGTGDETVKGTHGYRLEKSRNEVFTKNLMLLNEMRMNSAFSKFNFSVGGKFPHEEYQAIIECVQRILNYHSLMIYASQTLSSADAPDFERSAWSQDFRRLLTSVSTTANQVTSTLSLLSSSLSNGQPLPPYLELPQPFAFVQRLQKMDKGILSVKHIAEPEYSVFAVVQICGVCITNDIEILAGHVRNLVGEMDFSFKALNPSDDSLDSEDAGTEAKGKQT
ncbi:hypothetical protein B0A48_02064 [Cryoendolithus antarcticus]|uniref:ER transporter 6TM N-terminal domain-containing protein n=1 Tax=Cryoendolithus antarcticus TaxID=1507870 RepID=A0A1V8TN14_9PEZI|nr:hypothetical protein B0A48_02064 [Cryoendolithus antarcticus]